MYSLNLAWKEFKVDINMVEAWVKTKVDDLYLGCCSDYDLTLCFKNKIEDDVEQAIKDYWEKLTEKSKEVKKYSSAEDRKAADEKKKSVTLNSALKKLKDLGLTDQEIEALTGK